MTHSPGLHKKLFCKNFPGRLTLWCGWCFTLFLFPYAACFGQTITIHVVNVTNGHPLSKQHISISGLPDSPELRLVTDPNGKVQFELPKPTPIHFAVRADLSPDSHWYCSCVTFVTAEEVIQKGLIAGPDDKVHVVQPTPGEILFRARPTPWWVRLLYPLEKG
jgi:hypothetical protein